MRTKFLSVTIALMPILASYKSVIPNVDLGTFLVAICLGICLISKQGMIIGKNDYFVLIFLYVFIVTPLLIVCTTNVGMILPSMLTSFLRWGKYVLAFLLLLTVSFKEYYSEETVIKTMQWTSYLAVAIVIIQRLAYLWGIILKNPFTFLTINDLYADGNYRMVSAKGLFRPSAFFLEPSHFAQYVVFYLAFSMFATACEKKAFSKKRIQEALVLIAGILCTGSGMGVGLSVALFVIFIFVISKESVLKSIVLVVLAVIVASFLYRTTFIQNVLARIFTDGVSYGGNAFSARIGNGYQMFSKLPQMNKWVGLGYGHIPVNTYLNGMTYCLLALGIVGTALLAICLLGMFIGNVLWKKMLLIVFAIMLCFAQLFTPGNLIFVMMLLKKDAQMNERAGTIYANSSKKMVVISSIDDKM